MGKNEGQIVIKKYANRRLYNTGTSTYVTLDDLAVMNGDTLSRLRPLRRTPMMSTPMMVPPIPPVPPDSEVPPMTTAAMASSS